MRRRPSLPQKSPPAQLLQPPSHWEPILYISLYTWRDSPVSLLREFLDTQRRPSLLPHTLPGQWPHFLRATAFLSYRLWVSFLKKNRKCRLSYHSVIFNNIGAFAAVRTANRPVQSDRIQKVNRISPQDTMFHFRTQIKLLQKRQGLPLPGPRRVCAEQDIITGMVQDNFPCTIF